MNLSFDLDILDKPHARAKTASILQMDAMECGAVCLMIVLAYYGKYISSEEAREACDVSRDGSKAINIIRAARKYELNAYGVEIKDIEELRFKKTPFIVYWKFEHFIVVEQVHADHVYINDPASGPRKISMDEFDRGYTGIALFLSPNDNFEKSGDKEEGIFKILFNYIKDSKAAYTYITLLTLILAIPSASLALFIKLFVDNVLVEQQSQWVLSLILIMLGMSVLIFIITSIQQRYILRFKLTFLLQNAPRFFWKLLNLPMNFFEQRATGDIASRIKIYDHVAENLTEGLIKAIVNLFTLGMFIFIIFLLNHTLGLITLILSIINFLTLMLGHRKLVDLGRKISQQQAKLHAIEYGGFQVIEELKFRSNEDQFFNYWSSHQSSLISTMQRLNIYSAFSVFIPNLMIYLNMICLVILGCTFIANGSMSAGSLIAIYTLLLSFGPLINESIKHMLQINQMKGDLLRIKDVMMYSKQEDKVDEPESDPQYLLELKNVYFGYSRLEAPILSDINIQLKAGESLAVTGISGGGKSTLTNLIVGLFPLWKGNIFYKGKNIHCYDKESFFNEVAYVDQSISLFEGTIRENITLWNAKISDIEIIEALKTAMAYDFISKKGGLDFHITEDGGNLSKGQAQRIELARALVKKPQLLILDEVTSALDSVTEKKVYENLRTVHCSFVIIAHRLSAIKHCNYIMLIEQGQCLEYGTHDELMSLEEGHYRSLVSKEMI